MCTTGAIKLDSFFLFKTRDPVPGWIFEDNVKEFKDGDIRKLIVCNDDGMYGGINDKGVGYVGTYVKVKDGQAAYFDDEYMRKVLDGKIAKEAVEIVKNFRPFMGGNLIISDEDQSFSLEVGPDRVEAEEIKDKSVLTNHFLKLPYQSMKYNDPTFNKWTHSRFDRAVELLKNIKKWEDLKKLLSDHENEELSICNHGRYQTSSGFIIDTKGKRIFHSRGNPCETEFEEYNFKAK